MVQSSSFRNREHQGRLELAVLILSAGMGSGPSVDMTSEVKSLVEILFTFSLSFPQGSLDHRKSRSQ
jgi:hypothetical protein